MEDPKTSQASNSDTLNLGPIEAQFWTPNFQPRYLPILGATPFPPVQARRPQLDLSIPTSLSPLPYRLGAVGPKVGKKMGGQLQNLAHWPRNRCIQFLLQKCEIGVILSDMSRHA